MSIPCSICSGHRGDHDQQQHNDFYEAAIRELNDRLYDLEHLPAPRSGADTAEGDGAKCPQCWGVGWTMIADPKDKSGHTPIQAQCSTCGGLGTVGGSDKQSDGDSVSAPIGTSETKAQAGKIEEQPSSAPVASEYWAFCPYCKVGLPTEYEALAHVKLRHSTATGYDPMPCPNCGAKGVHGCVKPKPTHNHTNAGGTFVAERCPACREAA